MSNSCLYKTKPLILGCLVALGWAEHICLPELGVTLLSGYVDISSNTRELWVSTPPLTAAAAEVHWDDVISERAGLGQSTGLSLSPMYYIWLAGKMGLFRWDRQFLQSGFGLICSYCFGMGCFFFFVSLKTFILKNQYKVLECDLNMVRWVLFLAFFWRVFQGLGGDFVCELEIRYCCAGFLKYTMIAAKVVLCRVHLQCYCIISARIQSEQQCPMVHGAKNGRYYSIIIVIWPLSITTRRSPVSLTNAVSELSCRLRAATWETVQRHSCISPAVPL